MKPFLPGFLALGIGALALAGTAGAVRIDGLPPAHPVDAMNVTPAVSAGALEVGLPDARKLRIHPWPDFLPRRFDAQQVHGSRELSPAGPLDRLIFTRMGETQPWLIVADGARREDTVVGEWKLRFSGGRWSIGNETSDKPLRQSTRIVADGNTWCVYLLASDVPAQQADASGEKEPRAAYAAWRQDKRRARCPAPTKKPSAARRD